MLLTLLRPQRARFHFRNSQPLQEMDGDLNDWTRPLVAHLLAHDKRCPCRFQRDTDRLDVGRGAYRSLTGVALPTHNPPFRYRMFEENVSLDVRRIQKK